MDDVTGSDGTVEELVDGPCDLVPVDHDPVDHDPVDHDPVDLEPVDQDLRDLTAALEAADDLSVDERLALLRRAEEAIAGSLEGLDGL